MRLKDFFIPTHTNNYKAYLLRYSFLMIFSTITIILNTFGIFDALDRTYAQRVDFSSLIYLHNKERNLHNIAPLTINSKLIESAKLKADIMLESNCWSHYCPEGQSPWTNFERVDYNYLYAGENLAEGFKDNSILMKAWMASPTHKKNILSSLFSEVGIGFAHGDYQGIYDNTLTVVHFANPSTVELIERRDIIDSESINDFVFHKPQNKAIYNTPALDFSGKAPFETGKIRLVLNKNTEVETKIDNYTFLLQKNTYEPLNVGLNTVTFVGYDQNGIQKTLPTKIEFFVQPIKTHFSANQVVSIDSIRVGKGKQFVVSLPKINQIENLTLHLDEYQYKAEIIDNEFRIAIPKRILEKTFTAYISTQYISDPENKSTIPINIENLKNSAQKLEDSFGLEDTTVQVDINRSTLGINYFVPVLSTKSVFSIVFALLFAFLLWLEYYYISRIKVNYVYKTIHNNYLKIGFLVGNLIIMLLGAGFGSIL